MPEDDWFADWVSLLQDRERLAERAVAERDFCTAINTLIVQGSRCLTWPDAYQTVYQHQRVSPLPGFPVVMRGAKQTIYCRYSKPLWAIMVFERFLTMLKPTVVDAPLSELFKSVWDRLADKHCIRSRYYPLEYRNRLRDLVVVAGRPIPLERRRIDLLEKSLRIVEKIDALAA